MRVKIGPYVDWIGPYQIAEKILFWKDKHEDESVHKFGEFLAHGFHKETEEQKKRLFDKERPMTWFYKLCSWIHSKQKRKVVIKLDRWDTWNMDSTLAMLILPMLKQLKETKHGSPQVDLEDVPQELRVVGFEEYEAQAQIDFGDNKEWIEKSWDIIHNRWNWVLDEMIWTFEQLQPDYDWEDQYTSGEADWFLEPCKDNSTYSEMKNGPNHTYTVDWEARKKHQDRIENGLRLFGKYYQGLWD